MEAVFPAFGVKVFFPTPPLDTAKPAAESLEETGGAK